MIIKITNPGKEAMLITNDFGAINTKRTKKILQVLT